MKTEYRIVELHRRFHIEERIVGMAWIDAGRLPHVPRYFDSLEDARSWVDTIRKGVVYHDADAHSAKPPYEENVTLVTPIERLKWFIDRVGKVVYKKDYAMSGFEAIPIQDKDHAKKLHRDFCMTSCTYSDAPNLAQDERKAEDDTSDGIKSLEWFMERLDRTILRKTFVKLQDEHLARACYDCQIHNGYRYSDPC